MIRCFRPSLSLVLLLWLALLASVPPGTAALPLARLTGRVTGFDTDTSLLRVNSRLGPKVFRVTSATLVLLNNHSGTTASILPGDDAEVSFRFDTSEASIIHLTRQVTRRARVTNVTTTAMDLSISGAVVSFRLDTNTRVVLEGIVLNDRKVLIGHAVTVVYEPGTSPLLLSVSGDVSAIGGSLTAVDAGARTVTLGGRRPRTFSVDTLATLRRSGQIVALSALVAGDRVRIAFFRDGATLRALAIQVQAVAPAPEAGAPRN